MGSLLLRVLPGLSVVPEGRIYPNHCGIPSGIVRGEYTLGHEPRIGYAGDNRQVGIRGHPGGVASQ